MPDTESVVERLKRLDGERMEISELPGYFVTDEGVIVSMIPWRGQSDRPLAQHENSRGYLTVTVTVDGVRRKVFVHKTVCRAFHGDRPTPHHEVCHNNGNRIDNRADNLRWGTRMENAADRDAHGRTARGENVGGVRLTEEKVRRVRLQLKAGTPVRAIAREHGVAPRTIRFIADGTTWRHVA